MKLSTHNLHLVPWDEMGRHGTGWKAVTCGDPHPADDVIILFDSQMPCVIVPSLSMGADYIGSCLCCGEDA